MEEWRDIERQENYLISNKGRVKNNKTGLILKSIFNKKGYERIKLRNKTLRIHRLVAIAFIENVENKKEVNHIDGDKTNNNVSNLEWCTGAENREHASKTGLSSPIVSKKDIKNILLLVMAGVKLTEISKMYNINYLTVKKIKSGLSWSQFQKRKIA